MNRSFAYTHVAPPGGKWIWSDADNYVEEHDYHVAVARISQLLKCTWSEAVKSLEDYMCPRMPPSFCVSRNVAPHHRRLTVAELLAASRPYAAKPDAPADVIIRRLDACARCPRHRVEFCMGCTKTADAVYSMFGGRRVKLPGDSRSGVCTCANALAMAVASVEYFNEPVWEGAPETCWRNQ
jgi:hypothetical protein